MTLPRRIAAHLLLALALLCTQQLLIGHTLTHRVNGTEGQDSPATPAERVVCVLCVAGASSRAALPSTSLPLLLVPAQLPEYIPVFWDYQPPVLLAFSSRAPPTLL